MPVYEDCGEDLSTTAKALSVFLFSNSSFQRLNCNEFLSQLKIYNVAQYNFFSSFCDLILLAQFSGCFNKVLDRCHFSSQ